MTREHVQAEVRLYRARVLGQGSYSDQNYVSCVYFILRQDAFVSFWIEPVANVQTSDELFERMHEAYGEPNYVQRIACGVLTRHRLKFHKLYVAASQIAPLVGLAFKNFHPNDFSNATVVIENPPQILGTVESITCGEARKLFVVELAHGAPSPKSGHRATR